MNPAIIRTILGNAPALIQGASKLMEVIRRQHASQEPRPDLPATVDGLKQEIQRLDTRVDANCESDEQQVRLIEELARQNEALARSVARLAGQVNIITVVVFAALVLAAVAMVVAGS